MAQIYLFTKIREFFKLNTPESDLERGVLMGRSSEDKKIEVIIEEYCKTYNVSRRRFFKILYKEIKQTAERAAYRMRVNNGGFLHNFG